MPAGLDQITLASSAAAAPPASALPVALPLCTPIANPPAALVPANETRAAVTASLTAFFRFIFYAPPVKCRCRSIILRWRATRTASPARASLLLRGYNTRLAVLIDCDVREHRFGHLHRIVGAAVLCVHFDAHGNRGTAGPHHSRIETQDVADEYGLLEHERIQ